VALPLRVVLQQPSPVTPRQAPACCGVVWGLSVLAHGELANSCMRACMQMCLGGVRLLTASMLTVACAHACKCGWAGWNGVGRGALAYSVLADSCACACTLPVECACTQASKEVCWPPDYAHCHLCKGSSAPEHVSLHGGTRRQSLCNVFAALPASHVHL